VLRSVQIGSKKGNAHKQPLRKIMHLTQLSIVIICPVPIWFYCRCYGFLILFRCFKNRLYFVSSHARNVSGDGFTVNVYVMFNYVILFKCWTVSGNARKYYWKFAVHSHNLGNVWTDEICIHLGEINDLFLVHKRMHVVVQWPIRA
jgi:hypothetical protein